MQLSLDNIVPQHLRERATRPSNVWSKHVVMNEGSLVFVQAPSGAGKTTLMHILYGLRGDHSGTVHWGNVQLATADDMTLSKLRANDVSIIFQDLRLFPQLTAWENIMIKAQLASGATDEQATQWMERLGILHKKDSLASIMSYGEQQRTAIVRALVQPFKWLLMDEPFSHLDAVNKELAIALIHEIVSMRKAGMLYADLDGNEHFPYTQILQL